VRISNESLLVALIVGVVARWLAGQLVHGGGFGLIGDLLVGILGAFVGDMLFPRLGVHVGTGYRVGDRLRHTWSGGVPPDCRAAAGRWSVGRTPARRQIGMATSVLSFGGA
jgi:uncharacterized membrane protein YeaQ/YmgE (transglycosylase-associated protein family)